MELVLYPDPVLKQRARPIARVDDTVREKAARMFEVMYREQGVGLAAPQVGWSARLFVMNALGPEDPSGEKVYVNPRIVEAEGEETAEEGCLSLPEIRGMVTRAARIRIQALGLDGREVAETLEGLEARIFQHEFDHLDGILFVVRLQGADRQRARKIMKRLERDYKKRTAARTRP